MRALFVQHDHVSPPGTVAQRFRDRGFEVDEVLVVPGSSYHEPNVPFEFPDPGDYDVLVPMGAPWGAWDEARIGAWLVPELAWVREAIARDIPILGICFGGQLLARALGGSVSPAAHAEIGWTVVHTDEPSLVSEGPWFHFHYDSWTVPPGARELARTPAASQSFVAGRSLAVQFHPELDSGMLTGWLEQGGYDLVRADGQDADIMLAQTRAWDAAARDRAAGLVDAFLDRVALLR